MPIVNIPTVLREKLSDKGIDALVEVLNQVENSSKENALVLAESKFERRLAEVEMRLDRRIGDLENRISQSETRILRWLVVLWLPLMASHFLK